MQLLTILTVPVFLALLQTTSARPNHHDVSHPEDSSVAGNQTSSPFTHPDPAPPFPPAAPQNTTSSLTFQTLGSGDNIYEYSKAWDLSCETTREGSPQRIDIGWAGRKLVETYVHGTVCKNRNSGGSRCSEMARSKTGKVDLCGPVNVPMPCALVGHLAQQIALRCKPIDGRVMGKWVHKKEKVWVAIHN